MLSIYYFRLLFFFFYSSVDHRDLHSFPTRRSSDLSATPYFLGRVGQETNKPFPWVVSDFGLIDAIESGLVKIPQLDRKSTRLNSSHTVISYAVFCLKKKKTKNT